MKKSMLICGADGFIGKNALNFFKDKYNITAVTHNRQHPRRGYMVGMMNHLSKNCFIIVRLMLFFS